MVEFAHGVAQWHLIDAPNSSTLICPFLSSRIEVLGLNLWIQLSKAKIFKLCRLHKLDLKLGPLGQIPSPRCRTEKLTCSWS